MRRHDLEHVIADGRLAAGEPLERVILQAERGPVSRRAAPGHLVVARAHDAVPRNTEQLLLGAVRQLVAPVRPHDQDALSDCLDDLAQPPLVRFGLRERLLPLRFEPRTRGDHPIEFGADQGDLARLLSGADASDAPAAARFIAETMPATGRLSSRATIHASAAAPRTTSAANASDV